MQIKIVCSWIHKTKVVEVGSLFSYPVDSISNLIAYGFSGTESGPDLTDHFGQFSDRTGHRFGARVQEGFRKVPFRAYRTIRLD